MCGAKSVLNANVAVVADVFVSVWMITYNHECYIRRAIESVLEQQTNFDFEIVIGDDFSVDNTRNILLEYRMLYPEKIRLLLHPTNLGMIANQNITFQSCRGKYIAMLEGDDYWVDKMKLQIQTDAMKMYPNCRLSFHPAIGEPNGRTLSRYSNRNELVAVKNFILGGGYFCPTPSLMLDRSVVTNIPSFLDDAPAGDYYLQILGAAEGGGGLFINRVMCAYRINTVGSWSESVKSFHNKQLFRIRTIDALVLMRDYLPDYIVHFDRKIFDLYLLLAFDYLIHGEREKFSEYYSVARRVKSNITLNYVVVTFLHRTPWFLKIIYGFVKFSRAFYRRIVVG